MRCSRVRDERGKWWAIEHSGVQPDMVCIAKGIASGMPLGICMTKADVMNWVPGSHASTFGGNPIAIAAALATMDILEREGISMPGLSARRCWSGFVRGLRSILTWEMFAVAV